MAIMVDTGAWYAVCDISDRNHERARNFYEKVAGEVPLLTTVAILVETWALLAARLGRHAAQTFWQMLRETGTPVIALEQPDLEAAWQIMHAFPDQDFSFTDCTTFAVMERLRIEQVFTFDHHFLVYRYGPGRRKAFICEP
ncbi:Predicted nucleic acid-binding protein, contains PIN domain [Desulfofundulus australicus DSM 11792]|uniref:Predicted nucleic acid-binding protein, contains PIN domain n=2 Tax=Desulfofundulus australicus TaxID=1566 RepID=A0A1M4WRL5_9FIRM|nr:Predicted nucleic acid-binding protein, contains PIN domain [Desulfofundulus australicus DSM 11792]